MRPETLRPFARRVEALGYDELWIVEDCFYAGGIASAAAAMAATERVQVGIGILPAVMRNPAAAAMEVAALERLFPGRVLPGFGHGVAVSGEPAECARALRRLHQAGADSVVLVPPPDPDMAIRQLEDAAAKGSGPTARLERQHSADERLPGDRTDDAVDGD